MSLKEPDEENEMLTARMNSPVMVFGDAMKAMQALSKASAQGGVPPATGLLVVLRASRSTAAASAWTCTRAS